MDAYGQIGREKPDYRADLETLAEALQIGPVRLQIGERMTNYRLVLCLLERVQFLGGRPSGGMFSERSEDRLLFVAKEGEGAGWLRLGVDDAPHEIAEALTLGHPGDADVLAAFLNDVAGALERRRMEVVR